MMYRTPASRVEYKPRLHMPDCACWRCDLRRRRADVIAWSLFGALFLILWLAVFGAAALIYLVMR